MSAPPSNPDVPLLGSQYDLRVSLGEHVGETGIRAALESGETGFVHSFTRGQYERIHPTVGTGDNIVEQTVN